MAEDKQKSSLRDLVNRKMQNPDAPIDDEIITCLEHMRQDWLKVRQEKKNDQQWLTNLKFYSGDHYVRQNNRGYDSNYRVRLRENHINNIIQRIVSIVTQNLPIPRVFAEGKDWTDRQNAQVTEDYAKYYWRKHKLEIMLGRWIKNSCIFGDGFVYGGWNPDFGDRVLLDPEETEDGQGGVGHWSGDVQLELDQPFAIIPRPGYDHENFGFMPDFIRSKPVSRADLESKYGEISADSVKYGSSSGLREDKDMVMKNEYYHKPTPWWPEGAYICWAGKKLLKVNFYPYESFQKLPLIKLGFDSIPGNFFCMASMDQLIDLQEQINKAASMIIEARNLMARPRWLVAKEAKVAAQQITDRPGDIIRYSRDGGAPVPVVPNFNFGELAANKADLREALGQVSGLTAASRGEIPAAARTALALQLVLEQDRSQFLPFIKEMNQGIIDLMYMILQITSDFIEEDDARIIKIEGSAKPRLFHGGMVPSELDIYLEDTNPLGWTATGRIEAVLELVKGGLIEDKNQALEMIKIHSADPAHKIKDMNMEAAERENEDLMEGKLIEPLPEDIDEIHLDAHLRLISTYEFRQYPKKVQDAIIYHMNKHKERIAEFGPSPQVAGQGGGGKADVSPESLAGQVQPGAEGNLEDLLQK